MAFFQVVFAIILSFVAATDKIGLKAVPLKVPEIKVPVFPKPTLSAVQLPALKLPYITKPQVTYQTMQVPHITPGHFSWAAIQPKPVPVLDFKKPQWVTPVWQPAAAPVIPKFQHVQPQVVSWQPAFGHGHFGGGGFGGGFGGFGGYQQSVATPYVGGEEYVQPVQTYQGPFQNYGQGPFQNYGQGPFAQYREATPTYEPVYTPLRPFANAGAGYAQPAYAQPAYDAGYGAATIASE